MNLVNKNDNLDKSKLANSGPVNMHHPTVNEAITQACRIKNKSTVLLRTPRNRLNVVQ